MWYEILPSAGIVLGCISFPLAFNAIFNNIVYGKLYLKSRLFPSPRIIHQIRGQALATILVRILTGTGDVITGSISRGSRNCLQNSVRFWDTDPRDFHSFLRDRRLTGNEYVVQGLEALPEDD